MEEKTIRSISPVPLRLIAGAGSALAGLIGTLFFPWNIGALRICFLIKIS